LELLLSVRDLGVPDPAFKLVPGEDKAACCFFLTNGSNIPRASAKLAPVKDRNAHSSLSPQK